MGTILEMKGITKRFTGVVALKDVNLVVQTGEIHAICGENGAGKSTLMKVLSGVHPHGTYAVSYTHLDVYKRQVMASASVIAV